MDTRQLRYFSEIVTQGSISRAAAVLHVAQPALSHAVRTMEERLGTRLLDRSHAGVSPTEAGALLAQRARRILDDLARTEDDIRNLGRDPAGAVRIGLPGTIGDILALPLIETARRRYPRITITVAEAMSGFVADWLSEGRVDIAMLYARPDDPRILAEHLLDEELGVLWQAGSRAPECISMHELQDVPMILPSPAHGLRKQVDAAMAPLGFRPEIAIEVDSYANIKHLVAAGHGASVLPLHAVQDEAREGRLVVSRIAAPGLWRGAYLMHNGSRPETRAQEVVRGLLREVTAELLASGRWGAARKPA